MVPIFVVLTILTFVLIDVIIQAQKQKAASAAAKSSSSIEPVRAISSNMAPPKGLFIHPGHTWVEVRQDGQVRIGVDGFVQQALGRVDRVELRPDGTQVQQGEPMVSLEQNGRRIVLLAPISGIIQASNRTLETSPETIQEMPYGNGWLYSLEPSNLGMEITRLKVAETAAEWLQGELKKFTNWLTGLGATQPVPALQDGGLPLVGVLAHLDDAQWEEFQNHFVERQKCV